jgi:hypothetical protein
MPERTLVTIISENPNEKEVIFRRVDTQEIIPSEKIKYLKRMPIEIKTPHASFDLPISLTMNVPFDEYTNALVWGTQGQRRYGDLYPAAYVEIPEK